MKSVILIFVTIFLAGCSGCKLPSERTIYKIACEAVRADPRFPSNGVLQPMEKAEFFVGKNAARVDLPYDFVNESSRTVTDSYTVWLKNMAHSWQVDRCFPTPEY